MPKATPQKIIVAYVPVLHRGYLQFFSRYPGVTKLYVIGGDLQKEIDYLRKDLRALSPPQVVDFLKKTKLIKSVQILTKDNLSSLNNPANEIILPDEDISREVARSFQRARVNFYPIFLRWDRQSVKGEAPEESAQKTSSRPSDVKLMKRAFKAAEASSDIWRHVGAILLSKQGKVLGTASNQGEPSAHSPWMEGDPRNVFKQGIGIEMSVFMHAEAKLVAEAAQKGTSLRGASMYVTTFPCPACAKLIAHSGIKNLYYSEGYGVLDGRRVLQKYRVNLVRVPIENHKGPDDQRRLVPYKRS